MWLLKSLPNNVLCHVGIRFGIKGPNACITNHSVGGLLAIAEAAAGIVAGEADRAVAVGHDTPIEPQNVLGYHNAGLLGGALRPFDASRDGSLMGEGAGAVVVETEASAGERGARGARATCSAPARRPRASASFRSARTATGRAARSRWRWPTRASTCATSG